MLRPRKLNIFSIEDLVVNFDLTIYGLEDFCIDCCNLIMPYNFRGFSKTLKFFDVGALYEENLNRLDWFTQVENLQLYFSNYDDKTGEKNLMFN